MPKKNILFILPDQLRADFLGCYGNRIVKTPAIDALAESGTTYRRAYSPSPMCVPARASLLTGRNCIKTGVFHNDQWLRPDHDECGMRTWPAQLADAGYRTAAIGKMHFYPWDIGEGFQERLIAEDKRHINIDDDYQLYLKSFGLSRYAASETAGYQETRGAIANRLPPEHQIDIWVGDRTCEFIAGHDAAKPFALMVGFPGPHCPYDPPETEIGMYSPEEMPGSIPETAESRAFREEMIEIYKREWNGVDYTEFTEAHKKRIRAYYATLITLIDRQVGRIIDALKKTNQLQNTVIIFSSDHGDYVGDFNMVGKSQFFEPASHIPLIVRHPDGGKGQTVETPVSLTDLYATILGAAGIQADPENLDSVVLNGFPSNQARPRDYLFAPSSEGYMLIQGEWKYCRYHNGVHSLYNVQADPQEQTNLVGRPDHQPRIKEFDALLFAEIYASTQAANSEKLVLRGGLVGKGDFGKRGWKRTYPEKNRI